MLTQSCFYYHRLDSKKRGESDLSLRSKKEAIKNVLKIVHEPQALYEGYPGLSNEKQVELYTKYCDIVDDIFKEELCLYPRKEVMENVLKIKKNRQRRRAEDKAGITNKYEKRKSKERKKVTAEEIVDKEDTLDNSAEAMDKEEEATDNNSNTTNVKEDKLSQTSIENRLKCNPVLKYKLIWKLTTDKDTKDF